MSISSLLFGEDFSVKKEHTYITKILINKEIVNSRLEITFSRETFYPFTMYIRMADDNGIAKFGTPIIRENITYANNNFIFIVPQESKMLLIFEFDTKLFPEDIDLSNFNFEYNIEPIGMGNKIVTDMYMFETFSGVPYRPHMMGSYSEYEFNQKVNLTSKSDYMGKTPVSRMVISHEHENERGYIDRVYVLQKRGKIHGTQSVKNKDIKNKEEFYIYLDPLQNTKNIISNSNDVIRGLMFQTSDYPSLLGRIVFKFITTDMLTDNVEENIIDRPIGDKVYLLPDDSRNGVTIASCEAPDTINNGDILYGLGGNPTNISNPLTLRLSEGETFIEADFIYFIVYGNFAFHFKGRSNIDPTKMIDIEPTIKKSNIPSLTHTAEKTISGLGEDGSECIWYLISTQPLVSLYPKFSYDLQNFVMQPEQFIEHTFYYEILANTFSVIGVTDKNNLSTIIENIIQRKTSLFRLEEKDIPKTIRFPSRYPLNIYKYDDNIVFPLEKKSELPANKIINIQVKYKLLTALFKYIYISEETGHIFKEYTMGPKSIDTFNINLIDKFLSDGTYNYIYWGYQNYDGYKVEGFPKYNLYKEASEGGETFIYKFLYNLIKGKLRVELLDTTGVKLDLTKLYYDASCTSPVNNYKQLNGGTSGTSTENAWTTTSFPRIIYKIIGSLFLSENVYYEKVSPEISEYVFIPNSENELKELTVTYKRKVIDPELKISFKGTGCSWRNGYRGVFIDVSNDMIVGSISSNGAILTYDINSSAFEGVKLIEGSGLFSIIVDIEDASRESKVYELFLWNIEGGIGKNPHTGCNGFSLEYLNAGGIVNRTYMNSNYYYKPDFPHDTGTTFNNPGLSPVLRIKTGEDSTAKCFEVLL